MTYSSHTKAYQQIGSKPGKMSKYQKHNVPHERSAGKATTSCERCGTHRGVIRKYGINICRRCFREIAPSIGFEKYE